MESRTLDALYGGSVEIDLCHTCHSLWFDGRESLQLAPNATLQLFKVIHEKQSESPRPLQEVMRCPRCGEPLQLTHDMQRGTRFNYFRCPQNHGRQTPFFQFLKEKNLVRALDPRQLAELRARIGVVRCSNCGAPVDLHKSATCAHCHAVISGIDPEQVQRALAQLQQQDLKRQSPDPALASRLMMDRLQSETFYDRLDRERHGRRGFGRRGGFDLIDEGISAIIDLLT